LSSRFGSEGLWV
jgi:hypothetical protein